MFLFAVLLACCWDPTRALPGAPAPEPLLPAGGAPLRKRAGTASEPSIHTAFTSDCSAYQLWQALALVNSFHSIKQPGSLTRILACESDDLKKLTQEEREFVETHVAPSWAVHPLTGDAYKPYNKCAGLYHWLNHAKPQAEFVIILDADVIFMRTILPWELGVRRGHVLSALNGFMLVNGTLVERHIPQLPCRNNTEAGQPWGRRSDQVGGFYVLARQDLEAIAPWWIRYTEDVRLDPKAAKDAGEDLSGDEEARPWISEMYGYSFAAARAGVSHIVTDTFQYRITSPEAAVIPSDPPYIVHYSNELNLSDHNYFWDKQIFLESEFSAFVCPGQEDWPIKGNASRGLMPQPPHPFALEGKGLAAKLLAAHTVAQLNLAFCRRHIARCQLSPNWTQACAQVEHLAAATAARYDEALCEDDDDQCSNLADSGLCTAPTEFLPYMRLHCPRTCQACLAFGEPHTEDGSLQEMQLRGSTEGGELLAPNGRGDGPDWSSLQLGWRSSAYGPCLAAAASGLAWLSRRRRRPVRSSRLHGRSTGGGSAV